MRAPEHFLLAELELRIREGERRGGLEAGLAELRQRRPSLRARAAGVLIALAERLSPETVQAAHHTPARP